MFRPVLSPFLASLALLWACGAPPARPAVAAVPVQPSRGLEPDATFADLVDVARSLDAAGAGESSRRCLLGWSSFDADLTVPVHPLPQPWRDSAATLAAHADGVRVLGYFGTHGEPSPITVVPFTRVRLAADATAIVTLFLGAHGVSARPTHALDEPPAAPVPIGDLPDAIPLLGDPLAAVLVTADAATPLTRVRALLSRLREVHAPVALAVPLPVGATLPHDPVAPDDHTASCPNGLPDLPPGTPAGDLPPVRTTAVLNSWATAALACAAHVTPPGDLTVDLRIAGDGTVAVACAQVDTLGSAAVRRCILDVVRGSHFPPPEPLGAVVDLSYPFRLPRPGLSDAIEPLCAER